MSPAEKTVVGVVLGFLAIFLAILCGLSVIGIHDLFFDNQDTATPAMAASEEKMATTTEVTADFPEFEEKVKTCEAWGGYFMVSDYRDWNEELQQIEVGWRVYCWKQEEPEVLFDYSAPTAF